MSLTNQFHYNSYKYGYVLLSINKSLLAHFLILICYGLYLPYTCKLGLDYLVYQLEVNMLEVPPTMLNVARST